MEKGRRSRRLPAHNRRIARRAIDSDLLCKLEPICFFQTWKPILAVHELQSQGDARLSVDLGQVADGLKLVRLRIGGQHGKGRYC